MIRLAAAAVALVAVAQPAPAEIPAAPVHHDLRVTLDPETREFRAVDRIRLTGLRPERLGLAPGFVVDNLVVDGRATPAVRVAGGWRLALDDRPAHEIEVRYHGALAPLAAGPGRGGAGRAFADPRGSFLPGHAAWYPRFGEAAITYSLDVETPEGQRAVAPGRLAREETGGGRERARFVADWPAEDIVLVVGPYRVRERFHGAVRLRTYFHPSIDGLAEGYLEKTAAYLDLYERWIGAYPFTAFHVVSGPLPVGLGFPGFTYMGEMVLRLPFIRDTSLGHEVLHAWWGGAVGIDFGSGNWAEGLTTFMADYTFAGRTGAAAAREMRLGWLRDFAALPAARDAPVRAFVSRRHGAARIIGYHKAAMVFVMLRDEIGRAAFDAGIGLFWRRHRFRRASWGDLGRAFEEAAGRDLRRFFGQWLERTGAPSLALGEVSVARAGGAAHVSFTLTQGAPPYELSVPVSVETDTGVRRHRVRLDGERARFTLTVEGAPRTLEVDGGARLFRRLAPGEVPPILRHVMLDRATATVIVADGPEEESAARALAARLLEGGVREAGEGGLPPAPLLVVGTGEGVRAFLEGAGLPAAPARVRGRGTARVWSARRSGGRPIVVVEAGDAAALAKLVRPLPHYGGASFLVFDGAAVIDRGVWPPAEKPLRAELR